MLVLVGGGGDSVVTGGGVVLEGGGVGVLELVGGGDSVVTGGGELVVGGVLLLVAGIDVVVLEVWPGRLPWLMQAQMASY